MALWVFFGVTGEKWHVIIKKLQLAVDSICKKWKGNRINQ